VKAGGRGRGRLVRRLGGNRAALAGAVIIGLFVVVAVLAPLLAPYNPTAGDLGPIRPGVVPGPSLRHPLGLDLQGRDLLSRVIYGARYSLVIGVASVALGVAVGSVIGALAGGLGGWVDTVLMRVMDAMLAIPGLLIAIGVVTLLGPRVVSVMVAIGVGGVPLVARLLRGAIVGQQPREYVGAARALGASRTRVIVHHLLPNSLAPVLAAVTLGVGGAILEAAGLSFLGLGAGDPSLPEWGRMLAESPRALQTSPHVVLFPGLALVLTVLGFNLLGDALREAFDPRLAVARRPGTENRVVTKLPTNV
jgi:peptide/nickel transport system permease protein